MKQIPDETYLQQLSLPGTHNSMARYSKAFFDKPLTVCQKMTLRQQLESGVRAFDIRNRHVNNAFFIHHGPVYQKAKFGRDVAEVMNAFLEENPSETIVLHHQREHSAVGNTRSYDDTMQWYMQMYPRLTKLESEDVDYYPLGQARGKILINYDLERWWERVIEQNHWKVYSCKERDIKWQKISSLVDAAVNDYEQDSTLYINYVSGTAASEAFNPVSGCFPNLWTKNIAKRLNKLLEAKLANMQKQHITSRIGIMYMDFPYERLIGRIIKQNPFD